MAVAGGNTSEEPGAPQTLGDYLLLRRLGQGGMGQVWLAKLRGRGLAGIDKLCVVKTLRSSDDPEYERRFIDEARLIVLLTHKNICPVFDAGCFEGQYYVAMEHIAGRDLHALTGLSREQQAPLPVHVAIHIAKELLEALDAAHRMVHPITQQPLLIVHRDVSPQNVMVSAEGDVKLIDFGLAASSQKAEKTEPRVVMGKLAYMAPEQARGEALDDRTDQFAAGVILYELLANARYYEGLTTTETWGRVGTGGHEPAGLARLEPALAAIVRRATAARREDRYATCGDMCEALTAVELSRGAIASSRDVRLAVVDLEQRAGLTSTTSPELRRLERGLVPGATPATVSHPPVVSSPLGASTQATVSGASPVVVSAPGRAISMPLPSQAVGPTSPSASSFSLSAGVVSSSLPSLMPPPFEPEPVRPSPAAREHTRTFRIRREASPDSLGDLTQSGPSPLHIGSVAGFPSSAEQTEITKVMPTTSEEQQPPVVMRPSMTSSSVDDRQRAEPTAVIRGAVRATTVPEAVPSKGRGRLLAGAAVLVATVTSAGLWWASRAATTADDAVDAGTTVEAVEHTRDAGVGSPPVVGDAGMGGATVAAIVDAGTHIQGRDAGVVTGAQEQPKPPTPVVAGVAAPVEKPSTPSGGKGGKSERPRRRRQLDPLPGGRPMDRVMFLQMHCGDLACYANLKNTPYDALESSIKACYDECSRAPR
jgi:eukaryotic-like serine/threonine-protein kinase